MQDPDLWNRLKAHAFNDPGATKSYAVKLAAAEGWTPDFTLRVIEEYRKFLYLTQISRGEATPSEIIDRAWHMHLTFTRNYGTGFAARCSVGACITIPVRALRRCRATPGSTAIPQAL